MANLSQQEINSKKFVDECKSYCERPLQNVKVQSVHNIKETYTNIMGLTRRPKSHLLITLSNGRKIRVIVKYLGEAGGSVVDKLPTLMFDAIKNKFKEKEIIFVLGGDGFHKGFGTNTPYSYMANQAIKANKRDKSKVIKVFTEQEFIKWINKGMKR